MPCIWVLEAFAVEKGRCSLIVGGLIERAGTYEVLVVIPLTTGPNYMVRGACAPLMDSECHSMKTLVNAIDYACRLREGPGNKNISLGSVLKLLLVSHIAAVFAALLVVAVAKSHCIIWQLLWLPELLT